MNDAHRTTDGIEEIDGSFLGVSLSSHSLSSSKFYTSRKSEVASILSNLRIAGPSKVKIVSDFDYTISKAWVMDGTVRGLSCHRVLEDCGYLSDEYHTAGTALQAKYFPIENDPYIPIPEKAIYMEQWALEAEELLIEAKLTRSVITRAVAKALLRDCTDKFIKLVREQDIPVLILSAGIKEVICEILKLTLSLAMMPRLSVVSNECLFSGDSEDHPVAAFVKPTIHVFNKKASTFAHSEFFQEPDLPHRQSVLLFFCHTIFTQTPL
jgi:HAD superfamily hydrolase (TIGR01544 family)